VISVSHFGASSLNIHGIFFRLTFYAVFHFKCMSLWYSRTSILSSVGQDASIGCSQCAAAVTFVYIVTYSVTSSFRFNQSLRSVSSTHRFSLKLRASRLVYNNRRCVNLSANVTSFPVTCCQFSHVLLVDRKRRRTVLSVHLRRT